MNNWYAVLGPCVLAASLALAGCIGEVGLDDEQREELALESRTDDNAILADPADDPADDGGEPSPFANLAGAAGDEDAERSATACTVRDYLYNGYTTRLTRTEVATKARAAGVPCGYKLVKAVAVAGAESGRYKYSTYQNCGKIPSKDKGIFQINDWYWCRDHHECLAKYDYPTNFRAMAIISNKGSTWTPWVAYTNGSWKDFRYRACNVVQNVCGKRPPECPPR